MSNAGLQFGVLGPLQLRAGDALVPLGAPKQRAVLATLLMNRNRAVSVDALIDAVWDQSPVPAARTSIHSYVSNLRRLLGSGSHDPNRVLASVSPGYQLNVADADCDIGRFVTEKNAGVHAAAAGRFEDASTYLSAALAEWRGPLLDDLREFPFVDTFATALSEVRVAVQTALAEAEIACGRADAHDPAPGGAQRRTSFPRTALGSTDHRLLRHRAPVRSPQRLSATENQPRRKSRHRPGSHRAEPARADPAPRAVGHHRAAQTTATRAVAALGPHTGTLAGPSAVAELRGNDGQRYRLEASTRIGRRPDNDIVLDDDDVSRYHAVVIDTGGSFVISDLRSTNGVDVGGRRIRGSATLADGDHIRIGGHEFIFEIRAR